MCFNKMILTIRMLPVKKCIDVLVIQVNLTEFAGKVKITGIIYFLFNWWNIIMNYAATTMTMI